MPTVTASISLEKSFSNDERCFDDIKSKKLRNPYPFTWTPITMEEKLKRKDIYYAHGPWCVSPKASMLDLIRSTPGNVLMPRQFEKIAEEIYNFEVRPDDVFVVTYPKCGTTLTQELVWQILHDLDFESGQESLMTRSPFLEMQALTDPDAPTKVNLDENAIQALRTANNMKSPRVIKTHLPLTMLPPNLLDTAKVVFVSRNPMDCAVSFFHHEQLVPKQGFYGTFDQYAELFRQGNNPMGDYFYHLMSGWERRDHPNLEFVWFESLKCDIRKVIRKMSKFLGKEMSQEDVELLASHLDIKNFRKNKSVNMENNFMSKSGSFIRKGSVGGWKDYFTEERLEDWRDWIESNTNGTGIYFCLD